MKSIKILATFCVIFCAPLIMAADFKKDINYSILEKNFIENTKSKKIEVIEFFMYSCPHCFQFEPYLADWLKNKPKNISFQKVPAIFGGPANLHARTFYSLEALGVKKDIHSDLFEEIHVRNNSLRNIESIEIFLEERGIDISDFRSAMNSFAVKAKIDQAEKLMEVYKIRSVPKIVVNRKYKTEQVRTYQEIIDLTNYLIMRVKMGK